MDHYPSHHSNNLSSQHLLFHPHPTSGQTMTSIAAIAPIAASQSLIPVELEDLILCSCCHTMFNDTDCQPKMFACRHYFCLKCVNTLLFSNNNNNTNNNNNISSSKNSSSVDNNNQQYELYCVHCWKRTELTTPGMKPNDLPTYNAILYLTKNLNLFTTPSSSSALSSSSSKQLDMPEQSNLYQTNNTNNNNNISSSNNNIRGSLDLNNLINSCPNKSSGSTIPSAASSTKKSQQQPHENCLTHAMPFSLWCMQCNLLLCRACAGSEDHRKHVIKTQTEARELMYTDTLADIFLMQKYFTELQHFVLKQKEFLLKILESCTMLKTQIEMELTNHLPTYEMSDIKDVILKAKTTVHQMGQSPEDAYSVYASVSVEKQRLQVKHHDMLFQCKMDDIIRNYRILFDFDLIKKILTCLSADSKNFTTGLDSLLGDGSGGGHQNYFLMLANYCVSQLYTRHIISMRSKQMFETTLAVTSLTSSTASSNITFPQPPSVHYDTNDFLSNKFFDNDRLQQQQQQQQQQHSMNDTITSYIYTTPITASTSLLNPPSYAQLDLLDTSPSDDKHCKIIQNNIIKAVTSAANQKLMSINNNNNNISVSNINIPPPPPPQQQQPNILLTQQPSKHIYPIYYFNIEMNGIAFGRILIEVRNDVAPKMAKNFDALCTGEHGFGYKNCIIFQCWENESIITGDFELNNGRGGRSIYEESYFMPDDTKILAIRGSVGMRRSQKRHDNMGLVGSQFRIILREMRGFTGIFAFVIEGLELVEKISQSGDSTGKPQNNIVIVNCGKLH